MAEGDIEFKIRKRLRDSPLKSLMSRELKQFLEERPADVSQEEFSATLARLLADD